MKSTEKTYNLTDPQQSIYITEQLYKGTSIANISATLKIKNKVDFKLLEKAIKKVIKENDVFNIRIKVDKGVPKQIFIKEKQKDIELIEIENEEELEKLIQKFVNIPFSYDLTPLYRVLIFKFSDGSGGCNIIHSHLISDAWGGTIFTKKLLKEYNAILNNKKVIKKENYQYIDFIKKEEAYKKSNKFLEDKEYWHNKFKKLPKITTTNLENIEKFDSEAKRREFILTKKETKKILKYCFKNQVSIFTFFLTIYAIYFSRISQNEKVILGTPILNRRDRKERETLGMFVNTLPCIIDLTKNKKIKEIFVENKKEIVSIFRHQKYSYMDLLKHIRKTHRTNRGLYDIMISYQNAKIESELSDLSYKAEWAFNGNISETLNIHILDINTTGKLNIYYDYQITKHDEKYIEAMHKRILYIINQVIKNSNIMLEDIDIVPKAERKIIESFYMIDSGYPKNKTIVDLFERQAKLTPNNIAIKFKDEELTYKELNEKSNQLARYLILKGAKKNMPIALRMNKSLEMIISILAIIKAGCCYLPMDLSYPQERIKFMLKDSGAKLFLTLEKNFLKNIKIKNIIVDKIDYTKESKKNLKISISPDDLLYIIYTSGSTGTPKGVMLTHRNIVRLIINDDFQFDFDKNDVWNMFHSVAFDVSVWEMYGALLYGGKLIVVPDNVGKDPKKFLDLLRKEKCTILCQTPTFFYNLLDMEMQEKDSNLKIRYIIFAGEALKPNLLKPWKDKYNFVKLINMYGITETTVHVSFKELKEKDINSSISNIGNTIPTLNLYIMDNKQRILPIGIEGEICVSGDGVARGYLNRPELNKEKFIKDPFYKGKRMYRSADSAILQENGDMYYKGRMDTQVKIRGFRIELGEVETAILSYPDISKCIVLADQSSDKSSYLVAYIVYNNEISIKDLKEYLKDKLPEYMVPSYFVKVDEIPINSNGKVDRRYLKTLEYTVDKRIKYVAPRDDFEKKLKKIVEEKLQIKNIGIDEDILDLGADSLTLMQIAVELLKYNYTINIQQFYEERTIRKINDTRKLENIKIQDIKKLEKNIYFSFDSDFSKEKIIFDNVLLTGVTGFLGIHILYDLIIRTNANIYCLIRKKDNEKPKQRLINKIKYYFKDDFKILKEIDKRIIVIQGDITKERLGLKKELYRELGYKIDTVIHSAAIVDHYGDKEKFNLINVEGTNKIIDFCQIFKIKLNYISTISVSADFISEEKNIREFNEKTLYIGQPYYKNIYINTKFEAEYNIWKETKKGLESTIYRMGNITSRYSDGKFQENKQKNAFLNRISNFLKLDFVTINMLEYEFDMSPVDVCSKFIVEFIQYKSSYGKNFHVFNNNKVTFKEILNKLQIKDKKIVTKKEAIKQLKLSGDKMGIINDLTSNIVLNKNISINSDLTMEYMKKIGFKWPIINKEYIKKYVLLGDTKDEKQEKNRSY